MIVLKSIYNFLESYGRCRAAAYLASHGDTAGAHRIMMEDFRGWI
jgi:hypothetical protein